MNEAKRRRNSLRLAGYDYTQAGDYFITVCTFQRISDLSTIERNRSVLLPFGKIVHHCWNALPAHYPSVRLGEFVVMPNHIHGILTLTNHRNDRVRPNLSTIVGWFKSFSGRHINRLRRTQGARVWQRGFYDQIIRDDEARFNIRHYIMENPLPWELDRLHPHHPNPFPMDGE
jgi:putative transposase